MKANMCKVEKILRIVVGLALLGLGFAGILPLWVGLIGIIPLATGLISWCPAYALFGLNFCAKDDKK